MKQKTFLTDKNNVNFYSEKDYKEQSKTNTYTVSKGDVIWPLQEKASIEIANYFYNGIRSVLLMAEMQSGKTGVIQNIIYLVISHPKLVKEMGIKKILIITGMSEIQLRTQLEEDIEKLKILAKRLGIEIIVLSNRGMGSAKRDPEFIKRIGGNCLVIGDETHYGQNAGMTVHTFCNDVLNISTNGNPERLKKENTYHLSVSATAFSELINISNGAFRKVVILQTSPFYYGIRNMFALGKIQQAFNLKTESRQLKKYIQDSYTGKDGYILIRSGENAAKQNLQKILKRLPKINFVDFDSKKTGYSSYKGTYDINEGFLNIKPKGIQVIFLNGMIRAGKRINTDYVLMVHDTATTKNVDTVVQSLLGRCCGYNKNKQIDIFVNKKAAEKYAKHVEDNFSFETTPKGKNTIPKPERTEGQISFFVGIVPFVLKPSKEILNIIKSNVEEKGNKVIKLLKKADSFTEKYHREKELRYMLKHGCFINQVNRETGNSKTGYNRKVEAPLRRAEAKKLTKYGLHEVEIEKYKSDYKVNYKEMTFFYAILDEKADSKTKNSLLLIGHKIVDKEDLGDSPQTTGDENSNIYLK